MFVSGGNVTSIGFVEEGFSIGGAPRAPRMRDFARPRLDVGLRPPHLLLGGVARRIEGDRLLELGDGEVELTRVPVDAPALVVDLRGLHPRALEGDLEIGR